MNSKDIVQRLKEGNQRFVADKNEGKRQDHNRRKVLTKGQEPYAIILSCADSRVVPELTFDTGLGELFVVRVAGNIANTESIASIEYAVAHCKSKVILVLGHEACGAVTAAINGGDNGKNLNCLLDHINPVVEENQAEQLPDIIKANIHHVTNQLKKRSTIISQAVNNDELKIIKGYYNLDSGKVDFLD